MFLKQLLHQEIYPLHISRSIIESGNPSLSKHPKTTLTKFASRYYRYASGYPQMTNPISLTKF
jgi:hypothetical protein